VEQRVVDRNPAGTRNSKTTSRPLRAPRPADRIEASTGLEDDHSVTFHWSRTTAWFRIDDLRDENVFLVVGCGDLLPLCLFC